ILKGNAQLWTLLHLKYTKHLFAENGQSGGENRRFGANGKDLYVEVPIGTVVKDAETGETEAEITENGQEVIWMKGGRGGLGNDHFKSATNQAPKYAQPGESGIEGWKILELKVLADVGLVGFPNAGKSSLLAAVSAAKPEIADYPFTTLVPNLGIVSCRDRHSFVMADIPGIIEGASEGKGLGNRFLRHIERNALLLFMVSVEPLAEALAEGRPLEEAVRTLRKPYDILLNELECHNPELLHKKQALCFTKCDLLPEEAREQLTPALRALFGTPLCCAISSVSGFGIEGLKDLLWQALQTDLRPTGFNPEPERLAGLSPRRAAR
ncbi:MAG: GTPase ObgE, partial [Bacteroidales bacterium]|nr:GTPase ObgE [Bacteroidales bacterium]